MSLFAHTNVLILFFALFGFKLWQPHRREIFRFLKLKKTDLNFVLKELKKMFFFLNPEISL